ncbi:MAG: 16S rRNA (cytosine(1402)-N(4))-methyltransferase RsmH [Verrucomicrobiota bacterium]
MLLGAFLLGARPQPGERWVDGTFGRGGHSQALLQAGAELLALDRDQDAQAAADALQKLHPQHFSWQHANFNQLAAALQRRGWERIDGILLDLGVSSPQLDTPGRGFSFQADGPLDMRMDRSHPSTAADLVNQLDETELARLFRQLGGERQAGRIARALVRERRSAPFTRTLQMAEAVARAAGRARTRRVHPATAVFQALRLAVNAEPEALAAVLPLGTQHLRAGGRFAVISFHSGEDRVVKEYFRRHAAPYLDTPLYPNSQPNPEHYYREVRRHKPSEDEIQKNPRARSARLRIAVRNENALPA